MVLTNSDDTTDVVVVSLANATWSHNVTDFISSTISGLKQDVKYFLILQVNESVISNRYTLGKFITQVVASTRTPLPPPSFDPSLPPSNPLSHNSHYRIAVYHRKHGQY